MAWRGGRGQQQLAKDVLRQAESMGLHLPDGGLPDARAGCKHGTARGGRTRRCAVGPRAKPAQRQALLCDKLFEDGPHGAGRVWRVRRFPHVADGRVPVAADRRRCVRAHAAGDVPAAAQAARAQRGGRDPARVPQPAAREARGVAAVRARGWRAAGQPERRAVVESDEHGRRAGARAGW